MRQEIVLLSCFAVKLPQGVEVRGSVDFHDEVELWHEEVYATEVFNDGLFLDVDLLVRERVKDGFEVVED